MELSKDLVHNVIDRSMMVFDNDASPGVFTKRLISLMKVVFRRQYGVVPTHIILPETAQADIECWDMKQYAVTQVVDFKSMIIFGINAVFYTNEEEVVKMYDSLGGSFPPGDYTIVIIHNNDEYMLGSF